MLTPTIIISTIVIYFLALIGISLWTSRGATAESFYTGDKQSPWYLVAFGMIGTSLSGVTFVSVPGMVAKDHFTYIWTVVGYLLGYVVIAEVLLPLYYRLNLISIYTYLQDRFGYYSYQTGAWLFLVSRSIGAGLRLFLAATVLDKFVFSNPAIFKTPVPFGIAVAITIGLIWVYTFKGGIKTIVWTDSFQTFFMIMALVLSIVWIGNALGLNLGGIIDQVAASPYAALQTYVDKSNHIQTKNILVEIIAGMFICIAMTGLDQDMMQKNLTVKTIKDAKKNMYVFSIILFVVNLLFLSLGALLYIYAQNKGIALPGKPDQVYPVLAMSHLNFAAGIFFLLGIIAATYASSDSALAALTTSFIIDILKKKPEQFSALNRNLVHFGFSALLGVIIVIANWFNDESIIKNVFKMASYTYGPLLGLYAFGLFTKLKTKDVMVPFIAIASPLICFLLNFFLTKYSIYSFGFELLILNGVITFLGLLIFSFKEEVK